MDEATIEDGVPTTAGWFVDQCARRAMDAQRDARGLQVRRRGPRALRPSGHRPVLDRSGQADDAVPPRGRPGGLPRPAGWCVLVIEGEERTLRAWDFVHCPPGTAHTIVAAGDDPRSSSPWAPAGSGAALATRSSRSRSATAPEYRMRRPRRETTTRRSAPRSQAPRPRFFAGSAGGESSERDASRAVASRPALLAVEPTGELTRRDGTAAGGYAGRRRRASPPAGAAASRRSRAPASGPTRQRR